MYKSYITDSDGLIRRMTGTLVQGKTASSVTTADTKSGGVMSQAKLRGVSLSRTFPFSLSLIFSQHISPEKMLSVLELLKTYNINLKPLRHWLSQKFQMDKRQEALLRNNNKYLFETDVKIKLYIFNIGPTLSHVHTTLLFYILQRFGY